MDKDPHGLNQHEAGAKLDSGKTRFYLLFKSFPLALEQVAAISTYGAKKYTEDGWRQVVNGHERYTDAMLRHFMKECIGEEKDLESNIAHATHIAWNALARLELAITHKEEIDRTSRFEKMLKMVNKD